MECSAGDGVIDTFGIVQPLGGVEHFEADDIAVLVVVEDDAGLVLVALFHRHVPEENPQHIDFGIVGHLHGFAERVAGKHGRAIVIVRRILLLAILLPPSAAALWRSEDRLQFGQQNRQVVIDDLPEFVVVDLVVASNSHYAGLGWATVGWGGMKREDQTGV